MTIGELRDKIDALLAEGAITRETLVVNAHWDNDAIPLAVVRVGWYHDETWCFNDGMTTDLSTESAARVGWVPALSVEEVDR